MAGEIREQMAALRAAKKKMIDDITAEIAAVVSEVHAARKDGIDAMALPRGEVEAYRQEVREIRDEFAAASNGGPAGPLPGTGETSTPSSVTSAPYRAPGSSQS